MEKLSEGDLGSIYRSIESMRQSIIKWAPNTLEIKILKQKLLDTNNANDAMDMIIEILNLQLDYMKNHPELYPKYK